MYDGEQCTMVNSALRGEYCDSHGENIFILHDSLFSETEVEEPPPENVQAIVSHECPSILI